MYRNAKDFWGKSLKEYYCVDTSSTMNDLAKLILQEGNPNNEDILPKGLFYRQFLPASPKVRTIRRFKREHTGRPWTKPVLLRKSSVFSFETRYTYYYNHFVLYK